MIPKRSGNGHQSLSVIYDSNMTINSFVTAIYALTQNSEDWLDMTNCWTILFVSAVKRIARRKKSKYFAALKTVIGYSLTFWQQDSSSHRAARQEIMPTLKAGCDFLAGFQPVGTKTPPREKFCQNGKAFRRGIRENRLMFETWQRTVRDLIRWERREQVNSN